MGDFLKVVLSRALIGDDDRIISPYDSAGAQIVGQGLEGLDGGLDRRALGIEDFRIFEDCILKIITKSSPIKLGELLHERLRVSRPEDNTVDIIGIQRDGGNRLRIGWTGHGAISSADPIDQPFCIKSWNIRPAAGAYNH